MDNIVGIVISVERIEGALKVSQNKGDVDYKGVIDGLLGEHGDKSHGAQMIAKEMKRLRPKV